MTQNKKVGLAIIILGVIVLLAALPVVPQSIIEFTVGSASIKATDIPSANATMIVIGAILMLMGTTMYFGKAIFKR